MQTKNKKTTDIKLQEAEREYYFNMAQQILCERAYQELFEDRAIIVVENVVTILGAVQARMSAGKDPMAIAPGKEQALVDVVAGVRALQMAGPGADSDSLISFINQVQRDQRGDAAKLEVAAIKRIGRKSRAHQQVEQAFKDYKQAVHDGDQQRMQQLRNQFSKLYMFYQRLHNTLTTKNAAANTNNVSDVAMRRTQ